METLGWIAFYYLATGFSLSLIALGYYIFDIKTLWKRNDFFVALPIGFVTVVLGWFPLILLVIYAVLAMLGVFTCKLIKKRP